MMGGDMMGGWGTFGLAGALVNLLLLVGVWRSRRGDWPRSCAPAAQRAEPRKGERTRPRRFCGIDLLAAR
jgi:hypothetical protein